MAEGKNYTFPLNYIETDKEGTGLYSDVMLTHHVISQAALPLLLKAIESISVKNGSVFTIVDYGTADGGMSMPLIYACVKALREKYGDELLINVIYEDQPVNDFKSLFMKVHGMIPGPPTFLQDFPNVFVMGCGTSFYHQCLPNDSVTLGLSTLAMHWLRDKPCEISHAIFHLHITMPEEKEKFRRQAEKDWELILLNRAAEMIPGGRMIIVLSCTVENENPKPDAKDIFCYLWNILKGLTDEGMLTTEELQNMTFTSYLRTPEELRKPFECKDSPVSQAGLELASLETMPVLCRHYQDWVKEKSDAKEHAKNFVASLRTWSTSTFMAGLSNSRSAEEKATIVDEICHRYEDEVAKHPDDHAFNMTHAYLVVQKRR